MVIVQGLLILAVLQRLEKLHQLIERGRLHGDRLALGTSAPEFSGVDQLGKPISVQDFEAVGSLVLFLSPDCSVCTTLVDSIAIADDLPRTVVVCRGETDRCTAFLTRLPTGVRLLSDPSGAAATRYGVSAFPTAVVVDGNRKIRGYGHPKNVGELKRAFADGLVDNTGLGAMPELSTSSPNPT